MKRICLIASDSTTNSHSFVSPLDFLTLVGQRNGQQTHLEMQEGSTPSRRAVRGAQDASRTGVRRHMLRRNVESVSPSITRHNVIVYCDGEQVLNPKGGAFIRLHLGLASAQC